MANPTPEQCAIIAAHVTDWTQPDAQVTATLNALTEANPEPQTSSPRRLVKMEALGLLNPAHVPAVLNYPNLVLVYASFDDQDHASALSWVTALEMIGAIDGADAAAVTAYMNATVPDPRYQAQVPLMPRLIGRDVDSEDVAATRTTL